MYPVADFGGMLARITTVARVQWRRGRPHVDFAATPDGQSFLVGENTSGKADAAYNVVLFGR